MSGPAETHPVPTTIASGPLERALRLGPDDPFPDELLEPSLERLQVLHSRICRQLELEDLTDPEGRQWPRTKRSDDATAVYLVLS